MLITDQADIAIAMMRARLTPDQAIALAYGAEIADAVRDEIRAMSRGRQVRAARSMDRRSGGTHATV